MRADNVAAVSIKSLTLLVILGCSKEVMAQQTKSAYPGLAPVEQYLMDRTAEIAMARSAAPASISTDADVMVLGRHGFETAVKGKNGFVCIVQRSWTAAPDPDFWNPKVRVPMCANAPAARTYLVRAMKETSWILAGESKTQLTETIGAALAKKELPAMEPGAMCYMMSKEGYGGDSAPHWPSHLMFFYSDIDPAIWGANLPSSPVFAVTDPVEHMTQFVTTVEKWSDGTEDHAVTGHVHH